MHNTILLGLDLTVTLQKLHHVVYRLFALSVVSVHQFLSLIQAVLNCSTAQHSRRKVYVANHAFLLCPQSVMQLSLATVIMQ